MICHPSHPSSQASNHAKIALAISALMRPAYPAVSFEQCERGNVRRTHQPGLPQTSIAQVQSLRAGSHPSPVGELNKPICRLVALVGPKVIKLEIWLPTEGWNGKFQGVGNGGLAGLIDYGAIRRAIARGYAAAATDTGHTCATTACNPEEGTDLSWFTNEQQIVDYSYRAIHEMTVTAKEVIRAFYGERPRLSYFNGCSTGGGQALININRFPQDYDGVLAGAPSFNRTRNLVGQVWIWHAANTGPAPSLPQNSLALINKSVLAKCDALDGVADGIMEDREDATGSPPRFSVVRDRIPPRASPNRRYGRSSASTARRACPIPGSRSARPKRSAAASSTAGQPWCWDRCRAARPPIFSATCNIRETGLGSARFRVHACGSGRDRR
jgi:feruloyl esterase